MAERRIPFEEVDLISGLFGSFDSNRISCDCGESRR